MDSSGFGVFKNVVWLWDESVVIFVENKISQIATSRFIHGESLVRETTDTTELR